jgi:SAM-dependent methyltransferase
MRQKAGTAKRRLQNARRELFPQEAVSASAIDASARSYTPAEFGLDESPATDELHARLSESEVTELHAAIEGLDETIDKPVPPGAPPQKMPLNSSWLDAQGLEKRRIDLNLGVHLGFPAVLEKTGLTPDMPPEEVHAMTHSPLGAGGSFYHADLVATALRSAGSPIDDGTQILDFGCSSARVARVLAAAYPNAKLYGCDPNGPAIEWAQQNLGNIEFAKSENNPPLSWADATFDAAYGISIWSHYNEGLALKWYDEMHRVIKPGGHLISTTHGFQSVAFYGGIGLRSADQLSEIKKALYDHGYWYAPEFGSKGDWGVVNDDWGTSFVSQEWVLDKLAPKWQVVEYATARNEGNQDVYVLRRAD